jgi:hypothetical protein
VRRPKGNCHTRLAFANRISEDELITIVGRNEESVKGWYWQRGVIEIEGRRGRIELELDKLEKGSRSQSKFQGALEVQLMGVSLPP